MSSTQFLPAQSADPNRAIRVQRAHEYPVQIWIFLTIFLAILTFFRLGVLLVFWRRKRRDRSRLGLAKSVTDGKAIPWNITCRVSLRRTPLAVLNSFRILACRITVPIGGGNVLNGAEVAIIGGYIIALFTWEFINCMNVTTGVKFDTSYWSNRAAAIVRSQFPLLVALAGKNNIISFLTGISYEKLNVLHRAAARICLILIWVHFFGRVKLGLKDTLTISMPWVRAGIMTATAYTLLVIISIRPLRMRFYEFFFFSHVFLVLIILIGAYFHMRVGFGANSFPEVGPYLIPAFALWGFDRSVRLIRVIRNNRNRSTTSKSGRAPNATIELLSPSMVRVILRRNMTWRAGQSAFLIMPGVSNLPFEAHPFSIASIPTQGGKRPPFSSGNSSDSSKEEIEESQADENTLLFLIRVKAGFTRRLKAVAERRGYAGGRGAFPLAVYVDGPYGSPPDPNVFDSVILIAGGSGVTYALPMLQQIVHEANMGTTVCRSVLFVWIVPHSSQLSWIADPIREALESAPQNLKIRIIVYATQEGTPGSSTSSTVTVPEATVCIEDIKGEFIREDRLNVEIGRPNMRAVLEDALLHAEGHVSVDVAGPAGLAVDVRGVLSGGVAGSLAVLKGRPDVTLHVEMYGIA